MLAYVLVSAVNESCSSIHHVHLNGSDSVPVPFSDSHFKSVVFCTERTVQRSYYGNGM